MKTLKMFFMIALTLSILAGCSDSTGTAQKSDSSNLLNSQSSDNENNIKVSQQSNAAVTAEIIKSGMIDDLSVTTDSADVSLVSWDLGKSGHSLMKGAEVLCLKFHIINNCQKQMEIGNLFHVETFIDGVEIDKFGSDFYGDGRALKVWEYTELRAGAETDIYYCYSCSVNDSHKIEIDIFDASNLENGIYVLSDNLIDTFAFDIG